MVRRRPGPPPARGPRPRDGTRSVDDFHHPRAHPPRARPHRRDGLGEVVRLPRPAPRPAGPVVRRARVAVPLSSSRPGHRRPARRAAAPVPEHGVLVVDARLRPARGAARLLGPGGLAGGGRRGARTPDGRPRRRRRPTSGTTTSAATSTPSASTATPSTPSAPPTSSSTTPTRPAVRRRSACRPAGLVPHAARPAPRRHHRPGDRRTDQPAAGWRLTVRRGRSRPGAVVRPWSTGPSGCPPRR